MVKSFGFLLLGLVMLEAPRVQAAQCQVPLVEDQLPEDIRKACVQKIVAAVAPPKNAAGGPLTVADMHKGPSAKVTFSEKDVVHCRYYFKEQGGGSTKFRCYRTDAENRLLNKEGKVVAGAVSVGAPATVNDEKLLNSAGRVIRDAAGKDEEADEMKVRYSDGGERNRENHTSVAAGRILWALGIATERSYSTRQVVCFGCEKDPFSQRVPAVDGSGKLAQNTFPFASVERKFDGEKIGEASQSWNWDELASLYPTLTETRRLEFEALLLASNLVHVVGYSGEQHSLRCGEKAEKGKPCVLPIAVVHDVGAAFGNRDLSLGVAPRGDFAAWDNVKIFSDAQTCRLTLEAGPAWNKISEKGRLAFLERLKNLPKENVRAVFEAAHFHAVDSKLRDSARSVLVSSGQSSPTPDDISRQAITMWTDEFMSKVAEIQNARCL